MENFALVGLFIIIAAVWIFCKKQTPAAPPPPAPPPANKNRRRGGELKE